MGPNVKTQMQRILDDITLRGTRTNIQIAEATGIRIAYVNFAISELKNRYFIEQVDSTLGRAAQHKEWKVDVSTAIRVEFEERIKEVMVMAFVPSQIDNGFGVPG